MEVRTARANVARFVGNAALGLGLGVVLLSAAFGAGSSFQPYAAAGLLVVIGIGLRLEAAIVDRR